MISYHNHTDYSNLRGADCILPIPKLIKTAFEQGHTGTTITDHGLLSGAIKFRSEIKKFQAKGEEWLEQEPNNPDALRMAKFTGVLGYEAYIAKEGMTNETWEKGDRFYHLVLIAKNRLGFQQLNELCTMAWRRQFKRPVVRIPNYFSDLQKVIGANKGNIAATSACLGNEISRKIFKFIETKDEKTKQEIIEWIEKYKNLFGEENFFLELQPGLSDEQKIYNGWLRAFADKTSTKLIINLDAHYARPEDLSVHTAFINSSRNEDQEGESFYKYTYIMSEEEATENLLQCPNIDIDTIRRALDNGEKLRLQIEQYDLDHKMDISNFDLEPVPVGFDLHQFDNIHEGFKLYSNSTIQSEQRFLYRVIKAYHEKLAKNWVRKEQLPLIGNELLQIYKVGQKLEIPMSNYFLLVADVLEKIWDISLVMCGRGSCGSSRVAYLLDITQLNPDDYFDKDLFWRFIDESKVSLADIDSDSSAFKKPQIIEHLSNWAKANEKELAKIAAFGTTKPKNALLTACRGLGLPSEDGLYFSSLVKVERGFQWSLKECYYGKGEQGPISLFVEAMDENPEVWEVAQSLEGLIDKLSNHAAGVVFLDNNTIYERTGLMKTSDGTMMTQYNLEDVELVGVLKLDLLSTDATDCIQTAMELLCEYGYIEYQGSLKETYNKYFHPSVLNFEDKKVWDNICSGKIISLFQLESIVGEQAIKMVQPQSLAELAQINSAMRLMSDKELPLVTYKRQKENLSLWYLDMRQSGLTEDEIKILEPHVKQSYGMLLEQEPLMLLTMDKNICNFDLHSSDYARKIIGKKKMSEIPKLKEKIYTAGLNNGCRKVFLDYIWEHLFSTQMGYSFSQLHTTAYSVIGYQEACIYTYFAPVFWNAARLLVDSGAVEAYEAEQLSLTNEEDGEEVEVSATQVNYFKMASAIGKLRGEGVSIERPNINKSSFVFKPTVEENTIYFGLKGTTRLSNAIIMDIIANRPYNSLEDLLSKVSLNKIQATMIIKAGMLDELYPDTPRLELLRYYCELVADTKKRLTMQNFNGLMENNFIPDDFKPQMDLYKITKHMRKWFKHEAENKYIIDANMLSYVENTGFTGDIYQVDEMFELEYKTFEKFYKLQMEPVANWIKTNQEILLENYNQFLVDELYTKYAPSSMEAGELDALSYYYTRHELDQPKYKSWLSTLGVVDFYDLPEEPVITWRKEGTNAKMYKIDKIAGTCVGRDKLKKIVGFITPKGFVKIKVWQAQFVKYDRQIKLENGTKEPSWFSKGTKLLIQGYRSDDYFIPKYYKNSSFQYAFAKINNVGELQYERLDDLVANKPN